MTAAQSLSTLTTFLEGESTAQVLLATRSNDHAFSLSRLNLYEDVGQEFKNIVQSHVKQALKRKLRSYDPGYKPDPHDLTHLETDSAGYSRVATVVSSLANPSSFPVLAKKTGFIDQLRFYAIVVRDAEQKAAIFFRRTTKKFEIGRSGLALMLSDENFNKITDKAFLFDRDIDCFAWDGYLYLASDPQFRGIFDFFDELEERATQAIDDFVSRIPIKNEKDFRSAVAGQPQMLAKISRIAGKAYLKKLTMAKIRTMIDDFDLQIEVEKDKKGTEQLIFDPGLETRWVILKLMDDDYLSSNLTDLRYETNSKSALG